MNLGHIGQTKIRPIHLVAVAGSVGLATLLFSKSSKSATAWAGWHGPPVEVPVASVPHFTRNTAGHIQFTAYMIPLLMEHGLSREAAILFTAHLARETAYGSAVQNYNFGNLKTGQSSPQHPYYWLTDRLGRRDTYRAFDNAHDGLEEDIRFIRDKNGGRYKNAWAMLLAGDPNWYGRLGLDGYYEGPKDPARPNVATHHNAETIKVPQAEYNGIVALIRKYEQQAGAGGVVVQPSPSNGLSVTEVLGVGALVGVGAWLLTADF